MAEEPIRNVWLNNIRLNYRGGGEPLEDPRAYREQGTNYPEPKFAGPTSAYGLYGRHVEGLHVNGLTVFCERPDNRPVVVLDDVRHATIRDAENSGMAVSAADIVTYDCSDIRVLE